MAWSPFRHLGLKVAALALGTLLWLTVSGHQVERRVPVSVSYSNVPGPMEITSDEVEDASVYVRGGDNLVSALGPGDVRIIVDLSEAQAGVNRIPLRIEQVAAPFGIDVLQIEPADVLVTLEASGERNVRVQATIEGRPAVGYVAGEPRVEPSDVVVVGPESRLRNPVSVVADRVVIDGQTATVVHEVGVSVLDSQLRVREPRTVRVTVPITAEKSVR